MGSAAALRASASDANLCRELTRRSGSSFYYAFLFLPAAKREAIESVYAFCRLVDDAVDEAASPEAARQSLGRWRTRLGEIYDGAHEPTFDAPGTPEHAVVAELRRAVAGYAIRCADLEAVIEGCEWDSSRTRYATWVDLRAYCERVASAVGLACIEILGYRDPRARSYAVELGVALQLTNILRDVDEDAARGRIYLPAEDLAAFDVTEADLLAANRTGAVLRLLHFEAQRAHLHFLRAHAALGQPERARLVIAEIMADIYRTLLERLETEGFPARRRAALSPAHKAAVALRRFLANRLTAAAA